MEIQQTSRLQLAARFINSTGSHVFLTGKAGTGKTTFLRQLADRTHKNFLIVAPTGIAALHAGGVTIHSQFLLPFGSFIPETEMPDGAPGGVPVFTRTTLTRTHPLNSMRRKVLRATELLIIDEVSMLRADILDAVDFRMRRAKGDYSRSFGGAQLLMIGDLCQLPPIVNEEEWQVLKRYYRSMHFFEALAFRTEKMVSIELDRIFRQRDDRFIGILNRLRENRTTPEDIAVLNSRYRAPAGDEEPIIITTHNRTADSINSARMESLPGPSRFFDAEIEGDFPEKLYPLPARIELKKGAQLMFIRNDSGEEKAYVNGTLARVIRVEEDTVTVELRDSGEAYVLKQEIWENKKYTLNEERNELEEEVTGTFAQYPVRPAWAVTVHKSQGLTFDRAVIDVGRAFAPGQVYVALSRLRSLEGLILRTRVDPSCIMSDTGVSAFTAGMDDQDSLQGLLQEKQREYLERYLSATFDFSPLERQLGNLSKHQGGQMEFEDEEMRGAIRILEERITSERKNTALFRKQLRGLLHSGDRDFLLQRIRSGRDYYRAFMEGNLERLLVHEAEVEQLTRTKTYRNALGEAEQHLMIILGVLEGLEEMADCLLSGRNPEKMDTGTAAHVRLRNRLRDQAEKDARENPKFSTLKSGKKRKKGVKQKKGAKQEKGASARLTWSMAEEGIPVEEIAAKRELARSTIEGHLARGIGKGEIDIAKVMPGHRVGEIRALLENTRANLGDPRAALGEIRKMHGGKYSHGELRMVLAMMDRSPR